MSGLMDSLKYLLSHGIAGYLILSAFVFCLVIAVERIYFLFIKVSFDSTLALAEMKKLILARNYTQALQICGQQPNNPELQVIREGLLSAENGREAFSSAINGAVLEISRSCENRLSYLSLVASSATLLGLFGTILGLITTFQAIGDSDPTEKARLLGAGISQAMSSTAAGVLIGIIAMVVYTVCTSKADGIVAKVQKAALDLATWIEQAERSGAA